jgi:hypothetical protein
MLREISAKIARMVHAIKHRSTRLNFGRLCRWNHPPNHIEDNRKGAAKNGN